MSRERNRAYAGRLAVDVLRVAAGMVGVLLVLLGVLLMYLSYNTIQVAAKLDASDQLAMLGAVIGLLWGFMVILGGVVIATVLMVLSAIGEHVIAIRERLAP